MGAAGVIFTISMSSLGATKITTLLLLQPHKSLILMEEVILPN
jgi:hypothetical protein